MKCYFVRLEKGVTLVNKPIKVKFLGIFPFYIRIMAFLDPDHKGYGG